MKPKVFNVTGICVPELHYMVDVSKKLECIIHNYIGRDAYFTINRARQYGKTTTLRLLEHALKQSCIVVRMSFEGKEEYFTSLQSLAGGLCYSFRRALKGTQPELAHIFEPPIAAAYPMQEFSERISEFCRRANKRTVLMIDEVDKAADNQTFLSFLGMLREMYMARVDDGTPAFSNVILSGVHDIKNLKTKLRPEENGNYNSPWNIAAVFDVDMSFSPEEIATMLLSYEEDHQTGMDIAHMSQQIYEYTGGYPFLVSYLCKKLDEDKRPWTIEGLRMAVRDLLKENNTLFDDVIKNIKNHPDFSDLVEQIIVCGAQVMFEIRNPLIDLGVMYGIMEEQDGKVIISNVIFETIIFNYFTSVRSTYALTSTRYADKKQYIVDGRLNMENVLNRFAAFMKAEYRDEDGSFIERQGRLLFLSFLRPIINGTGHYAVEPQTRQNTRMDIQVFYGNEEFIVELKIWHGEKQELKAYDQLTGYLSARGVQKGYLLSFCENKKAPHRDRVFVHNGFEIYEVVVSCRT